MKILVLNAGSSSLKYQLFEMPSATALCVGLAERIGQPEGRVRHRVPHTGADFAETLPLPNHAAALHAVMKLLMEGKDAVIQSLEEVGAVGHRVVHGAEAFAKTVEITAEVKRKIQELSALAPLHNPANLQGIEVAEAIFPHARQVAVFDTAFHQSMPPVAYRMGLPKGLYKEHGIRAYGFHGSSHSYVTRKVAEAMGKPRSRLISIHLGNGCSMAAVKDGRSMDVSMGLGPMGGLLMGTRAGDVDPSVIFHLLRNGLYTAEQLDTALNKESGLMGMCGHSDMRDVKQAMAQGDPDAQLAYHLFAYRIRKYIGAYAAVLNGVDALIFTAGIGENDADMRAAICTDMDYLGVELDPVKNTEPMNAAGIRTIHSPRSKVLLYVVATDEEKEIALQVASL